MIKKLILKNFKNFQDAELSLGPLNILVGTNASGKSNIRDAFRFIHGIGRGYSLADILGEKYVEGGILQWRGIRGGLNEIAYQGAASFSLDVILEFSEGFQLRELLYKLEIEPNFNNKGPRVIKESLYSTSTHSNEAIYFDSYPEQPDPQHLTVKIPPGGNHRKGHTETFIADRPILGQIVERIAGRKDNIAQDIKIIVSSILSIFRSMRFLDLSSEAMRIPSFPGQTILGDRGENLSSVLKAICEDEQLKKALVQWLQELTPMDAVDFEFPADQQGRIIVSLVEESGKKTSAYSASDGTLRFLAMIAALLGPEPAHLYFFEELENGIHPTRLYLLLQLIESKIKAGEISIEINNEFSHVPLTSSLQLVATSHSPQLLRFLEPGSLKFASVVYRLPKHNDAKIKRILDIADAEKIMKQQDLGRLLESGWLEDATAFLSDLEAVR